MGNLQFFTHYNNGNDFFRHEKLDNAITEYKLALDHSDNIDPKDKGRAYYNLGLCQNKKDLEEALTNFRLACECNKKYKHFPFPNRRVNIWDFFISYRAASDQDRALSTYSALNDKSLHGRKDRTTVFLDQMGIEIGIDFRNGFEKALEDSSVIILFISDGAVAKMRNASPDVEDNLVVEWELALKYFKNNEKKIFPIHIGNINYSEKFPEIKCPRTHNTVNYILTEIFKIESKQCSGEIISLLPIYKLLQECLQKFEVEKIHTDPHENSDT